MFAKIFARLLNFLYISKYKTVSGVPATEEIMDLDPTLEEMIKNLEEQLITFHKIPGLEDADFDRSIIDNIRLGKTKIPQGSFLTLIPNWKKLNMSYTNATNIILSQLESDEIRFHFLQQREQTEGAYEYLKNTQHGDIYIVPVKLQDTNISFPEHFCLHKELSSEFIPEYNKWFGIGVFAVLSIILSSEYLNRRNNYHIDTTDDEDTRIGRLYLLVRPDKTNLGYSAIFIGQPPVDTVWAAGYKL